MNTSTKWIASAVTAVAIFLGSNVNAQTTTTNPGDTWRLGVGVEAGIPTGAFVGGTAGGEAGIACVVLIQFGVAPASGSSALS